MSKVISYLKTSLGEIILIIIFLILQAACDIKLPDYTSKIVNIGIQQGGIESAVPKVMRESAYYKIKLFSKKADKSILDDNYKIISKQNLDSESYNKYLKEYPLLVNEPLYVLKDNAQLSNTDFQDMIKKPILSIFMLESSDDYASSIKNNLIKRGIISSDNTDDIFTVLSSLPENAAESVINSIETAFSNIPYMIQNQAVIEFIRMEYISSGLNIDNMQTSYILKSGIRMISLAFLSAAFVVSVVFLASRTAAKMGRNLRHDVYSRVLNFSNESFEKFSTASLITRTSNDITQVQTLLVMLLRMVFYAPILGVFGLTKVLDTNKSMTWIIGVALIAILGVVGVLFGFAMPKFKIVQILVDRVNKVSREILTGIPVIRAFANEEHEIKRFDEANTALTKTNLFVNRILMTMMPLMMFIMNAITILIVYAGSYSINNGFMQVGDLMAFIQYSMQIVMAFLLISMVSVLLPRALVCAKRIGAVLNEKDTMLQSLSPQNFLSSRKGSVEFKNVSFAYPDSEETVLKNISFTAKPNKITAIIGSTGSGKSTLIKLIPRLFDIKSGTIYVNGIDIKTADITKLREIIGFVPQKAVLFSGSIYENIKFGNENITLKDVENAAEIAQCMEFIESKEEKFNSHIAQGGGNVSGGQKQRLSIARAIAKKPDILIFDDSFSALDYKTDAKLRKELKEKIKDCTYIIVAQRISTVKDADNIIVLDKGEIKGKGTHKELMKNCEVYRQIAFSQLSKEELQDE